MGIDRDLSLSNLRYILIHSVDQVARAGKGKRASAKVMYAAGAKLCFPILHRFLG